MTANEAATIMPPHVMRYFVSRTIPNRQVEFSPEGDTISSVYDEFDRGLRALQTDPTANEARAIVYAYQDETKLPIYTLRFKKVAFLIQMPHLNINAIASKEKGSSLTVAEERELDSRITYARRWLETYAPSEALVTLRLTLPDTKLSLDQITYLTDVKEQLSRVEWTGVAIHAKLHDAKNTMQLTPGDAFGAIYRIFLNRDSGPQAGWFLAALDKEFVLRRLDEATQGGIHG